MHSTNPVRQQQHPDIDIQVLVPAGMPVTLDYHRDQSDLTIAKYIIKRNVPADAQKMMVVSIMVNNDNNVREVAAGPMYMMSSQLIDEMQIATVRTDVIKILLVVEWLETSTGKWVLDSDSQHLDIAAVVKDPSNLPPAKFVENQ